jgi:hypothetical protein
MLRSFLRSFLKLSRPALLCCALSGPSYAADAPFEVRSAYVEPVENIYLLTAQFSFSLPDGARQAVRDGVLLTLDVDLALHRARRFWFDDSVASLKQQYELGFHALSERFVVRNLNSGDQVSFASLEAALDSMNTIRGLPVLDAALIEPDENYEFSLRATLDVRTLPEALRWVLFWADDWRQRSVWYTWSLPR